MTVKISGSTFEVPDNSISTAKLQRGAVTPEKTQVGALPSMVRLNTANGYGSTNNKIRRFTNIVTNQGTDITYTDSATLGASFTINADGVYSISYCDYFASVTTLGLSLNTSQPTTIIYSVTDNSALIVGGDGGAPFCSWTGFLSTGDIIRAHTAGIATNAGAGSIPSFTITRVA